MSHRNPLVAALMAAGLAGAGVTSGVTPATAQSGIALAATSPLPFAEDELCRTIPEWVTLPSGEIVTLEQEACCPLPVDINTGLSELPLLPGQEERCCALVNRAIEIGTIEALQSVLVLFPPEGELGETMDQCRALLFAAILDLSLPAAGPIDVTSTNDGPDGNYGG
jgi:hypothetical protein